MRKCPCSDRKLTLVCLRTALPLVSNVVWLGELGGMLKHPSATVRVMMPGPDGLCYKSSPLRSACPGVAQLDAEKQGYLHLTRNQNCNTLSLF